MSIAGRNVEKAYSAKLITAPDAAIHQKPVGEIIAFCGLSGERSSPLGSRSGSRNHNTAGGANTSTGAAATARATRHPHACATGPVIEKLSRLPTGIAIMNPAMARDQRSAGTRSAIQLAATGAQTASPTPTPNRVTSSIA